MGWIDDMIIKLSGGYFSIAGLLNVSAGSIVTEKDKFITSKGVTKVIQITQMPFQYREQLLTNITNYCRRVDKKILINSYIEADRCMIPINHPTFVSKANKALQEYYQKDKLFRGLDTIHQRAGVFRHNGVKMQSFGVEDVIEAKAKADSYTEVRNHIRGGGGVYFLARLFIHITYPNNEVASAQHLAITNYVGSIVKQCESMEKKMGTYLLNMSPSVTNVQNITSADILASQESLASLIPYRAEGLAAVKGNLMGTDVNRKTPFFFDPYSTDEGSSAIIVGKAGEGKTVFAYHYSIQSMANETTSIYLDLKGSTVANALGQLMDNYEVINFSGKNAKFINPLILNKINSNYEMNDAVNTTALWLSLMVNLQPNEGNEEDLLIILKSAIRGYYTKCGVSEHNKATYINSLEMNLGGIVELMGTNRNTTNSQDELKLYEIATKRISALLNDYNMIRNDNAIDIASLYDKDAIIFDFDKDTEVTVNRIDIIRIFSVIFFTKQISSYNKANEQYTMLVADEGNQYIDIQGLMQYISDLTARARSSNTAVLFITNDLSVVERDEMSGFRSNIAMYVVGNVVDDDLTRLKKINSSRELHRRVQSIVDHPRKYRHSFAVSTSLHGVPVNAIVRADMPAEIAKAFATRTVKE